MSIPPPETSLVDRREVWCDGATDIRSGKLYRAAALGHPKIYFRIGEKGWVDCGYCDRRFVLEGNAAAQGLNEASPGDLPRADNSDTA